MPAKPSADPIDVWFRKRGWQVQPFQREVWQAYADGESGLIHAPTGTGKTLAAWFGPVREALAAGAAGDAGRETPMTVLWITPLRALAADTTGNLQTTVDELGLNWRVERRTGDTPSHVKQRQRSRLPTTLVTTPESLSLLLSYRDAERRFAHLQCVIVDEWHELLGSKRGVQLELCLAHLRARRPELRIWGLSATLGNLAQAAEVLLGRDGGRLVRGPTPRATHIRAVLPTRMERFPWAGHLGTVLVDEVLAAIDQAGTTLLFTNTRAQAELWHQALLKARPDWFDQIALHHGSLDRKLRDTVEDWLRAGSIRCVVATSSLDLGVDFSPVDQVIQVGSPKGVARLLQRAGRSGHRPDADSAVLCVPTHAFELVEIAAARRAAAADRIESRRPLQASLDVLVQHLVTLALGPGFAADEQLQEIRSSHAYRDLDEADWQWVLDFITTGGSSLKAYPQFHKVVIEDGVYRVVDRRIAQRHRMAVGTITSDSSMRVQFQRGGTIGYVEEAFISRLRPGDQFLFSGRLLELIRVRDMTAQVRAARGRRHAVPRWVGGRMPLSSQLADSVRELLDDAARGDCDEPEMRAVRPVLDAQARLSAIPRRNELLIEQIRSREGTHLFVYPFAGRLVHEGLSALLAWRLSQERPATFTFSVNDYGFELVSRRLPAVTETGLRQSLRVGSLLDDLRQCLNAAEMARRHFREIARIAGLVFQGYPGQGKSSRQIQASSGLIFDVFRQFDGDNRLLHQTERELFEGQLELGRLRQTLQALEHQTLRLTQPERLTPLAFPLWVSRIQSQVSSEDWQTRVNAMLERLESKTPSG